MCPAVVLSAPVDAREYASLRKKLASGIACSTLKSSPASCAGKVVEVRGRLSGIMKSDSGGSIIISHPSHGSFIMSMAQLPTENPGVELACLLEVHEGGDCRVAAWTYDAELRRLEEAWAEAAKKAAEAKAKAAAPPAEPQPIQDTAAKAASQSRPATVSIEGLVPAYKNAIKGFNPKLSDSQADTIARSILGFSSRYKLDARLVCAVILAESHFRINATSRAGAQGLGQLMPGTAAGLGVTNPYDPVDNIYGSVRYVKSMLDRMSGSKPWNDLTWSDLALALAAYNAGPGAVKKHGGIPPYRETQAYVKKVTSIYKQLCGAD